MLEEEVNKNQRSKGFIFDGFPRTTKQAEILDKFLSDQNLKISMTIALDVDEKILIKRLLERGKQSGRTDDQDILKIQNRFYFEIFSWHVSQVRFHYNCITKPINIAIPAILGVVNSCIF